MMSVWRSPLQCDVSPPVANPRAVPAAAPPEDPPAVAPDAAPPATTPPPLVTDAPGTLPWTGLVPPETGLPKALVGCSPFDGAHTTKAPCNIASAINGAYSRSAERRMVDPPSTDAHRDRVKRLPVVTDDARCADSMQAPDQKRRDPWSSNRCQWLDHRVGHRPDGRHYKPVR